MKQLTCIFECCYDGKADFCIARHPQGAILHVGTPEEVSHWYLVQIAKFRESVDNEINDNDNSKKDE